MTALQALALGLIQGIAEFLPISSSGHLALLKDLLGLEEIPLLFDVILHVATLFAVIIVLRRRIAAIFAALWNFLFRRRSANPSSGTGAASPQSQEQARNLAYILPILIATAVTGVLGYAIQEFFPSDGTRAVSGRMLFTALVLGLTFFVKPGSRVPEAIGWKRAAFVGFAQGIGVFSGVSRSGMTISAGLFSGLDRATAGEYSFLLSIPAIGGAFLLTLKDAGEMMGMVSYGNLALSALAAFVSGLLSLKILLRIIKGGKIYWFALYLMAVGLVGLIFG
ncbi:MAG: undecaprenyl-diphosphate phosphatase [Spirochaetia bacterium]|jgi:undecaprenyl-diphosphatase|nr:undecaprenyl-diphosphate phosphatase [Spirochaetales bacterium]MDX9784374.1 undecaprenyl-diphosphate phosphatase [Spirochaetia bacterium]